MGRDMIDAQSNPSSSPGVRITLQLNNSFNLFVIFIALTLMLRLLLNWKTWSRPAAHFLSCLPPDVQTAVITIWGNCVFLKRDVGGGCRYTECDIPAGREVRSPVSWQRTASNLCPVSKGCLRKRCCRQFAAGTRDALPPSCLRCCQGEWNSPRGNFRDLILSPSQPCQRKLLTFIRPRCNYHINLSAAVKAI